MTEARPLSLPVRLAWTATLAIRSRGQPRLPFLDPEEIRALRDRAVRRMVAHAYSSVPGYAEAIASRGVRLEDFRTAEDLVRLPLLEIRDLQIRPAELLSTEHPPDRCLALRSGGSTGTPHGVRHDPGALISNVAHGERDRAPVTARVGRWAGYRQLSFGPPSASWPEIQMFVNGRTIRPASLRIERLTASVFDDFETAAERIDKDRPDVVHGYGSYIGPLFRHIAAAGRGRHRPRVVTYSSDALPDADHAMIEEDLGIPVLGRYQAVEALKIAFQCGAGPWMHVNEDLYPVRIVDEAGDTVPDGEPGQVVISNLVNRATVLLNYRLGDRARRLPGACPCGRGLPRMSLPEGRLDDWVALPSGEVLHPQAVRSLFTGEVDVWEYQVVQETTPTRFRINLVVDPAADRDALARRTESKFSARMGPGTTVSVAFVQTLARTPGGKVRGFIRQSGSG